MISFHSMSLIISCLTFLVLSGSGSAYSQEPAPADSFLFVEPRVQVEFESDDSLHVVIENDQKLSHGVPLSKSPGWAAARSTVFPGWGQAYVGNWISAIVFAGAEAGLVYGAYVQHDRYVTALDNSTNVKKDEDRIVLERSANFYRDDRNKMFWYIAGLTIIASMDAYVEAHLYDFHIDPVLSTPPGGDGIQAGLRFTFSL